MSAAPELKPELCNCLALRQAARHVTQHYDRHLAPAGLRTTQFSILAKLRWLAPLTINALALEMVMDRTTLGRNIQPLLRAGLIRVAAGSLDKRTKELHLTEAGRARLREAAAGWTRAQAEFERGFGRTRAAALRKLMRGVVAVEAETAAA